MSIPNAFTAIQIPSAMDSHTGSDHNIAATGAVARPHTASPRRI
jgi:hypothetical protein